MLESWANLLGLALPTVAISSCLLSVMAAKYSALLESKEPGRALLALAEFIALSPGSHHMPQAEKTVSFFAVYPLSPLSTKLPSLWAVQMCWYHPGPCITFLLGKKKKKAAVAVPMEIYYFNKILRSTQNQTNSCSETSCFPWIHWISGWARTFGI